MTAHELITAGLQQLTPDLPIISEEADNIPYTERQHWQRCWLIDPLDGTKEFIGKTGEFAINIALVEDGKPILGVVYAPVLAECYSAIHNEGAWKQVGEGEARPIQTATCNPDLLRVIVSRRHSSKKIDRLFAHLPKTMVHSGSALKICKVAEGVADIYPRLGETSEWDTGAGQCILEAAGGKLMNLHGEPLHYNKESLLNPHFLAVGDVGYPWLQELTI